MFVAERFLSQVVNKFVLYSVSSDGGTWYPQVCRFLKINHYIRSSFDKSLIERTIQHIKDRDESFDDYFPYKRTNVNYRL